MMTFRKLSALFCGLWLLFLAAGCATAPKTENAALSKKVGEVLLQSFIKNDAKEFLAQLPKTVSDEFGINGFNRTRESMLRELGTPIRYDYVLNLEHPLCSVSIWKITFERKSSDGTQTIRQETLFRAVSAEIDGKEKLLGFHFF